MKFWFFILLVLSLMLQISSAQDVGSIITPELYNQFFLHTGSSDCGNNGFYSYDAFIAAARTFNGFGTTGDAETRRRELAAFLAQTSHETTGGWPTAPDGPFAWGYCFITEREPPEDYCTPGEWPCAPGRRYFGRGPIQLTHNYNYGPAGQALGQNLIDNPDLLATDRVLSFRSAIWFWMTPRDNKPSCHDVITGRWTPSDADRAANWVPGYGVITNIINGGIECGRSGPVNEVEDRIGFYRRYAGILNVGVGENLNCYGQTPFNA